MHVVILARLGEVFNEENGQGYQQKSCSSQKSFDRTQPIRIRQHDHHHHHVAECLDPALERDSGKVRPRRAGVTIEEEQEDWKYSPAGAARPVFLFRGARSGQKRREQCPSDDLDPLAGLVPVQTRNSFARSQIVPTTATRRVNRQSEARPPESKEPLTAGSSDPDRAERVHRFQLRRSRLQ